MVASPGSSNISDNVALVPSDDSWVHQVFHRSLRPNIHTALRIASPAVESPVVVVVGVGIGSVLDTVIALSVEPVLTLDKAGQSASDLLRPPEVRRAVHGHRHLHTENKSSASCYLRTS